MPLSHPVEKIAHERPAPAVGANENNKENAPKLKAKELELLKNVPQFIQAEIISEPEVAISGREELVGENETLPVSAASVPEPEVKPSPLGYDAIPVTVSSAAALQLDTENSAGSEAAASVPEEIKKGERDGRFGKRAGLRGNCACLTGCGRRP